MRGTMRERAMRMAAGLAVALALVAAAGDAAAQPREEDRTLLVEDSLPLPADTVRLTLRPYGDKDFCDVIHGRVVDDAEDVAWLRRWSQCAHADFGDLREHTLVRVTMMGDCHATFRIEGWSSASRREYRLLVTESYGGCRAGGFHERWISVPALPAGWRVRVSEARFPEEDDRNRWPYSTPIPRTPGSISVSRVENF